MKKIIPSLVLVGAVFMVLYTTKAHTGTLAQEATSEATFFGTPIPTLPRDKDGNIATGSSSIKESSSSAIPIITPEPTIDLDQEGEVLSAENEFKELTADEELLLDKEPPHECSFETFTKTVKKGGVDKFIFQTSSKAETSIVKNEFLLGILPKGVSAVANTTASKEGHSYKLDVVVAENAQKGSFSIPLIYKEITNKEEVHTTMCQFNLIVE